MVQRFLAVLLVLALVACGESPATVPDPQTQTVDGVEITLTAERAPVINAQQTWVVTLAENGQPLDGADVYLDLAMPAMEMGQNKPLATPLGNGQYRAEGLYSMGGTWEVTVFAEVAGREVSATFPVEVPE